MKISLNAQQLADTHTLAEVLDVAQAHGVGAVELWPANLTGTSHTPEEQERLETKDVAAAAELLGARGFEVACVTLGFHAGPLCVANGGAARFTDALVGAVDAAAKLDADLVNCYTAGLGFDVFTEAMRPAAAHAASLGIVITVENEAHDDSASPEAVARAVTQVDSPGFRTVYDPCNYYHSYIEPYPYAYEILKTDIAYVHLKGGCRYVERPGVHRGSLMRGSDAERIGYVPLEESAFNIDAVIRRLVADGYDGWLTLEPHVAADFVAEFYAKDLAHLRAVLAGRMA